jgi:hypothetical protein
MTQRKPTKAQLEREKARLQREKKRTMEKIKNLRWHISSNKNLSRHLKKRAAERERAVKELIVVARRRDKERIKFLLSAERAEKDAKKLEEQLECLIATK